MECDIILDELIYVLFFFFEQDVLPKTDVLYQTRVQKERFTDLKEYEQSKGIYVINKQTLKNMRKTSIIMHPFPRVDEITEDVDADVRA